MNDEMNELPPPAPGKISYETYTARLRASMGKPMDDGPDIMLLDLATVPPAKRLMLRLFQEEQQQKENIARRILSKN